MVTEVTFTKEKKTRTHLIANDIPFLFVVIIFQQLRLVRRQIHGCQYFCESPIQLANVRHRLQVARPDAGLPYVTAGRWCRLPGIDPTAGTDAARGRR